MKLPHKSPTCSITGTTLKRIACASMLLDHLGAALLESGLLAPWLAAGTVPPAPLVPWFVVNILLRLAGRIAFPIYCFLLVEGFLHTRNVQRYLLRLLCFALLSEVPFDCAFFGGPYAPEHQNVYFTLFLGLLCLLLLRRFDTQHVSPLLARIAAIGGCGLLAWLLRTDYDCFGVLLIAVLYLLRSDSYTRNLSGCLLTCWELTAPLAFVPISRYSGERGRCPRWEQYVFYAFYPLHLAVLAAIRLALY